jgi:hypothetical protein
MLYDLHLLLYGESTMDSSDYFVESDDMALCLPTENGGSDHVGMLKNIACPPCCLS